MKSEKTQRRKVNNQFDNLVTNALDFLIKAINEIDTSPKHTIIDFYTAVELLIKARLLKEHWTLIIKKIESADFDKFSEGDFQSVSLEDGNLRLKKIVGEDVGDETYKQFDKIRKHRNQLVHFHYKNNDLKEIVAGDVLKGLYFLNSLLDKWQPYFDKFKPRMLLISEQAHQLRDYLQVKFEILKSEIDKEISRGAIFLYCASCGFQSLKKVTLHKNIFSYTCKVCDLEETSIQVNCSNCGSKISISEGNGVCQDCNEEVEIEKILESFEPEEAYDSESLIEREQEFKNRAYCDDCGWLVGKETVFPINNRDWLCISCEKSFDFITECPHCATLEAGAQDLSLGCTSCR